MPSVRRPWNGELSLKLLSQIRHFFKKVLRGRPKIMHDLQVKSIHSVSIKKVLGENVLKHLQIWKRTLGVKKEIFVLKSLCGL